MGSHLCPAQLLPSWVSLGRALALHPWAMASSERDLALRQAKKEWLKGLTGYPCPWGKQPAPLFPRSLGSIWAHPLPSCPDEREQSSGIVEGWLLLCSTGHSSQEGLRGHWVMPCVGCTCIHPGQESFLLCWCTKQTACIRPRSPIASSPALQAGQRKVEVAAASVGSEGWSQAPEEAGWGWGDQGRGRAWLRRGEGPRVSWGRMAMLPESLAPSCSPGSCASADI